MVSRLSTVSPGDRDESIVTWTELKNERLDIWLRYKLFSTTSAVSRDMAKLIPWSISTFLFSLSIALLHLVRYSLAILA